MRIVIDGRSIHPHRGGIGRAAGDLFRAIGRAPRSHEIVVLVGPHLPVGFELPGVEHRRVEGAVLESLGAALFVYPSLYEGFGLPPLEAMALGLPCVTSDATSLPEVVGNVALTVDVRDPGAFAETLKRGLEDERFRRRAARKGPERARRFSWDRAAAEVLDLCESLEAG